MCLHVNVSLIFEDVFVTCDPIPYQILLCLRTRVIVKLTIRVFFFFIIFSIVYTNSVSNSLGYSYSRKEKVSKGTGSFHAILPDFLFSISPFTRFSSHSL